MHNIQEKVVSFTGWESDRFVRYARWLRGQGIDGRVRVIGREPITTVHIDFVGKVINTIWEGYKRVLEVYTDDGIIYQVGGSNSTRPVAAENVLFLDLPNALLPCSYGDSDVSAMLSAINLVFEGDELATENIKHSLRVSNLGSDSKQKIIDRIMSLYEAGGVEGGEALVELLGIIESPEVLEPMREWLQSGSEAVRLQAALRFRGLEPVIKGVGETSVVGSRCIHQLVRALSDPCTEVRIYSAEDLGYFYNDEAFVALVEALRDPGQPEHVRWAAAIALGRTNRLEIVQHLIEVLEEEVSYTVKQGAMLGLGRVAQRVLDAGYASRLISTLSCFLAEGPTPLQDYAAYTLGELGDNAAKSISLLVDSLEPTRSFELKSNSVLAISKLLAYIQPESEIRERIASLLAANLDLTRPENWPGAAYYNWYLVGSSELAALLEYHELSHRCYLRASSAFRLTPWLSLYYEANAEYELAENLCSLEDLVGSLDSLEKTISLFASVKGDAEFRRQSENTFSGLQFKVTLATARKYMISAVARWQTAGLSVEDYTSIRELFREALDQYKRIDVLGLSGRGKKLSKAEADLVTGLQQLTDLGIQLINLKLVALQLNEEKILLTLGTIRVNVRSLSRFSTTRSNLLREFTRLLCEAAEATRRQDKVPITEVVEEFLNEARQIYARPLPTPGTCPVIDFGSASFRVELRGSISGDGTRERPFIFPSDRRLIFEFTVTVSKRTKNDRLVLRGVNSPQGARDVVEEIPVHESSYSARPVDYGLMAPSHAPTSYVFILEFRNQGCSQQVQALEVFVRFYNPQREFTEPRERMAKRKLYLNQQKDFLNKQIADLQDIAAGQGVDTPLDIKQALRTCRAQLELIENEISSIREGESP